jgi:hypothetical protein
MVGEQSQPSARPGRRADEDLAVDTGTITTGASGGTTPTDQRPRTDPLVRAPSVGRQVAALGAVLVALMVLALIVVTSATNPATRFGPGTPEGAFQAYLAAWDARDLDGAYATFSGRVQRQLTIDEYRATARDFQYDSGRERRVVLLDSTVNGDEATLELRVDELGGGGIFGARSVWSREITVDLVREAGSWRLDMALANLEPVYWYAK